MKLQKKWQLLLAIFLFGWGYLLLCIRTWYLLVPVFNNLLVLAGILCIFSAFLWGIILLALLPLRHAIGKALKFLALFLASLVFLLAGLFAYIYMAFEYTANDSFSYRGEQYYYLKMGFPDPMYCIYKRTGFFTRKDLNVCREEFPEKITDENAPAVIDGSYGDNSRKEPDIANSDM